MLIKIIYIYLIINTVPYLQNKQFAPRFLECSQKNESFIMSSKQITMVCLNQLVSVKHQYSKFKNLFNISDSIF